MLTITKHSQSTLFGHRKTILFGALSRVMPRQTVLFGSFPGVGLTVVEETFLRAFHCRRHAL
jgi:hypothetical protein